MMRDRSQMQHWHTQILRLICTDGCQPLLLSLSLPLSLSLSLSVSLSLSLSISVSLSLCVCVSLFLSQDNAEEQHKDLCTVF